MADEARTDRITAGELAEVIGRHPDWHDLPVLLLSMSDDAVWLTEVEQDCFDPADGPVLSLLAHAPAVEEPLANRRPVTADLTAVLCGARIRACTHSCTHAGITCAREAGHAEAYHRDASGNALWLAEDDAEGTASEATAWPHRIGGCQCDWLEAENQRLWKRAAQADYETTRADLRAAQLRLTLVSVLRTFGKQRRPRSDAWRTSQVETAKLHRWWQVFEANPARTPRAGSEEPNRQEELRERLVAAGTEAAEQWLSTRAERRMSAVNSKRLAGYVVGTLWDQIEQTAIQMAQWIAEGGDSDPMADFRRTLQRLHKTDPVGAELVEQIVAPRSGEQPADDIEGRDENP